MRSNLSLRRVQARFFEGGRIRESFVCGFRDKEAQIIHLVKQGLRRLAGGAPVSVSGVGIWRGPRSKTRACIARFEQQHGSPRRGGRKPGIFAGHGRGSLAPLGAREQDCGFAGSREQGFEGLEKQRHLLFHVESGLWFTRLPGWGGRAPFFQGFALLGGAHERFVDAGHGAGDPRISGQAPAASRRPGHGARGATVRPGGLALLIFQRFDMVESIRT